MVAKAFEMGWAGVAFKTIGMFVPEEVSTEIFSAFQGKHFICRIQKYRADFRPQSKRKS